MRRSLTIDEILAAFATAVADGDLESAESWFAAARTRGLGRACGRPPGVQAPVRSELGCRVGGPVRTHRRR
jgi:hypothetical protein